MATTLNLGTNIWANESAVPTATGRFSTTGAEYDYMTGGSAGIDNRFISNSSDISSTLHADLISKLTVNSLTITNISAIKVGAGASVCITNVKYGGGGNQYAVGIAVGAGISITSHDMTGKTAIDLADFTGADLQYYTNVGDADTVANILTSTDVTATETFTNTGLILDACTPIGCRSSGAAGWIVFVGLSDTTESGLQTALADYVT